MSTIDGGHLAGTPSPRQSGETGRIPYIADVQDYFRCLDTERARAFVEAREVSDDYARFLNALE